jgi:outer membrane protein
MPDVNLGASAGRQKAAATSSSTPQEQSTYGWSGDLSYLLFNFGGRRAGVEETRRALEAADWTHNQVLQDVILRVEEAYYGYISTRALAEAEESTFKEMQSNLDAAEVRHKTGLATIADVLAAKTALSQVALVLEGIRGQISVTRGALATAMGLPANTTFDVELPPPELPAQKVSEDVDQILEQAKTERPDLAAAQAQARKAEAHLRKVKADGWPSLSLSGSLGRVYRDSPDRFSDPYAAAIQLRFPFFTGFSHTYDVYQSQADLDAAQARVQSLQQQVVLQVWSSYYSFKTAEQRVVTSDDLLASATESHDVAAGRYKAGVGSILDLLSAQAALESARAQRVLARSDWFTSLAQLAHDSGTLRVPGTAGGGSGNDSGKEGRP